MEGRANGSDVHAHPVPTERLRRLKAVICASAIRKFQMQGTALSPGRHRSGRRMGGALKNPAKTQRSGAKAALSWSLIKIPSRKIVLCLCCRSALPCFLLLADMKAEAVQTLQLRPDILNRKMESCPDTIRLRSCQFFDNSGRKPGQFLSGDTVALKELLEKEDVQSKENRCKAKRLACKTVRNLRQMPSPAMEVEAEQWLIRTTPAKSCTHCERWSAGGEGPDTGSADSVFSEGREKRRV